MFPPSILAHGFSALVLWGSLVYAYLYLPPLDAFRTVVLLLLAGIALTLHGISHLGLEKEYGFPFKTKIDKDD